MENTMIIGYLAAFCTATAFIPQAIKAIRTRDTKSLSLGMYAIFTLGVSLWCLYGVIKSDYPIIIANAITAIFSFIILFLKIKNDYMVTITKG